MKRRSPVYRRIMNGLIQVIASMAALLCIFFFAWIILLIANKGIHVMNWQFFTQLPTPPGIEGGGIANAILGSFAIVGLAILIGVPIAMLAGIYLAEFGQYSRFGHAVRFATNMLMGVPSIIIGLFVYTLMVLPMGHFSGYAGAVALSIIILPIITRTTEDVFLMVPNNLRESALALGASRWRMILQIILKSGRKGLVTGIVLAVARVSGETAPLLFTALNNAYWVESLNQPTANLTVTIFNYALSPYSDWQQTAWGAAFLITMTVLLFTIIARLWVSDKRSWRIQ